MNRRLKRTCKKILAFLLSAICGLSVPLSVFSEEAGLAATAPLPAENAVHLSDAGDFIRFAESCSSDVWSRDRVFILDSDIDLSGTGFSSVPTFGGIFLGHKRAFPESRQQQFRPFPLRAGMRADLPAPCIGECRRR